MNKHHGGSVKDYLKEKGIYEEVKELAEKKWKKLMKEQRNARIRSKNIRSSN